MIPTKMLVFKGADGATHSETLPNVRTRRKKSTGDLFQKGYRVRIGHGHDTQKEEEDPDDMCHKFCSCLRLIFHWGKTRKAVGRRSLHKVMRGGVRVSRLTAT